MTYTNNFDIIMILMISKGNKIIIRICLMTIIFKTIYYDECTTLAENKLFILMVVMIRLK